MTTTAIKVAIIKAIIFSKSNNDDKTEFYKVKANHLKLFPVATKKYLRCGCDTRCDTNK